VQSSAVGKRGDEDLYKYIMTVVSDTQMYSHTHISLSVISQSSPDVMATHHQDGSM